MVQCKTTLDVISYKGYFAVAIKPAPQRKQSTKFLERNYGHCPKDRNYQSCY